jgi:hypothetical protein
MSYFLVASEEQWQAVMEQKLKEAEDWLLNGGQIFRFAVLLAGTASENAQAAEVVAGAQARWAAAGATGLEVVDLRPNASVRSDTEGE